MQDFPIYAPPPAVQWALLWQSDGGIMQPYKFIELYTNFLLRIYMIPFIAQLTSPHVLLEMLTVYLYQELEPPWQKTVFIFVVHKFGTHTLYSKETG